MEAKGRMNTKACNDGNNRRKRKLDDDRHKSCVHKCALLLRPRKRKMETDHVIFFFLAFFFPSFFLLSGSRDITLYSAGQRGNN